MALRFRKRIRVMPGVHLNLSNKGISTSLGKPGATINVGKRGVRGTVGLPGTGLSYSSKLSGSTARQDAEQATGYEDEQPPGSTGNERWGACLGALVVTWLFFQFIGWLLARPASPGLLVLSDVVKFVGYGAAIYAAYKAYNSAD